MKTKILADFQICISVLLNHFAFFVVFQLPTLQELDEDIERRFFDEVRILLYVSLSIDILGFLTSTFTFASSCVDYTEATKSWRFVTPWVLWCFMAMAFNIGCVLFFYTTLHGKVDLGSFVYKFYVNSAWPVFCAVVGISYIINIKKGYRPKEQPIVVLASVSEFQTNPSYTAMEA